MLKSISSSDLRAKVAQVLNEVVYGQHLYVIEKFGEPAAAIINMEDFRLLQQLKQWQDNSLLRDMIANLRQRGQSLDAAELDLLVESAREEFHQQQTQG